MSVRLFSVYTLTHGCLKVHVECLLIYVFLLVLYNQESINYSLENVWKVYSGILSPDPQAMIPDLNVKKQRSSTPLRQHILQRLSI